MARGLLVVAFAAAAVTACRGPDEVIPPVVLDAPPLDAAELDAPADSRVDAPSDGRPALPDMTLVEDLMTGTIQVQDVNFSAGSCEQQEGCIGGPGSRRLLRFSTVTANLGTGDLYFGPPQDNPLFQYSDCHGHYHFSGYADYELVDGNNVVVEGHKQAFCLLDTMRVVAGAPGPYYTCENQGIGAGWADSYANFLPCQWIDITDVMPGMYTLRVRINPDLTFEESDYSNNTLDIPVTF